MSIAQPSIIAATPPSDAPSVGSPALEPDTDIIERAVSMRDLIREHAPEGDSGKVAPVVIDELARRELFRLTVPKRYGGLEVNQRTLDEVLTALAQGDGSTAWSTMLISIGNWFATTWPSRAQDELWGDDQHGRACIVLAPTGTAKRADDGGYRVTGKWPYASGSYIATHAIMGALVEQEDGSQRPGLVIFQPGQWTIDRTWYPLGLCGTGSDTVVVEDAEVPAYRIQYLDDCFDGNYGTEHRDTEDRANAAFLPAGTIIFAAVLLGLAKAVFELSVDRIQNKGVPGTIYFESKESPSHQFSVAKAAGLLDMAEMLVQRSGRDIDEWAARHEFMPALTRARVRHDTGVVVELVTEATDLLLKAAGSSAFMTANPLSRFHRDIVTGGSHVHATPGIARDNYGKLLLGSEQPLGAHV